MKMDANNRYDVIIAGAGPAGCSAAIHLGKAGIKTLLLDKALFPRDKTCGDALGGNSMYEISKMGESVIKSFNAFPGKLNCNAISFISPDHSELRIQFTKPRKEFDALGYISSRLEFDYFLLMQAQQFPSVTIKQQEEILGWEWNGNENNITTNSNSYQSKLLLDGSGAHSFISRKLGNELNRNYFSAGLRQYWQNVSFPQKDDAIELYFFKGIQPGYLWVFPMKDNRANVGITVLSKKVKSENLNLKELMHTFIQDNPLLKDRFKDAVALESPKGYGLPLGSVWRTIHANGVLLMGDSAGLIDPFTGEGIGNAMASGRVAAEAAVIALKNQDFSVNGLSWYPKRLKQVIGKELSASHFIQKLQQFEWFFNKIIRTSSKNESINRMVSAIFTDPTQMSQFKKLSFYIKLFRG